MEIVLVLITILLVVLLLTLLKWAHNRYRDVPLYNQIIHKVKKRNLKKEDSFLRMFVAVRRRSERNNLLKFKVDIFKNEKEKAEAVHANFITFNEQDYQKLVLQLREQIQKLTDELAKIADLECGFHGSDYGLPSSTEENWLLFASYIVPSYSAYRACLAAVESNSLLLLRDHCEIRLLYGNKMVSLAEHIHELF
jgi:hypothetical protein